MRSRHASRENLGSGESSEQVYSKGGFNATNPQPTPAEVAELIESLTEKASGKALPLTDDEKAAFQALHDAQIAKGKSKH